MITVHLIGDREVVARLAAMPGRLQGNVARTVGRLGLELQHLVMRKLSGQVLRVRTGVLRSSINLLLRQSAGQAIVASVGTAVKYAGIHEFGGTIPARTVRPKTARALAFTWKGQARFFAKVEIPPVKMPQRSFLRSALREMTPRIGAELRNTVAETVHRR